MPKPDVARMRSAAACFVAWLVCLMAERGVMGFSASSRLVQQRFSSRLVVLGMGKGLGRSRNKQQELARKMALAKKQNQGQGGSKEKLSAKEIKERNDRLRFEQLLKTQSASVGGISDDEYLTPQQEEKELTARYRGVDQLFEGDPAPTDCFEELVSIKSENAIGKTGADRLVPWLRKNPNRRSEYLAILTDPRKNSPELRQTIKRLSVDLPEDVLDRLIVVNADTPAENRRWMKKNGAFKIDIFSDEKMEWLQKYTALGQDRWSMCLFVVADEQVVRIAREVDGFQATRVVSNAVKDFS